MLSLAYALQFQFDRSCINRLQTRRRPNWLASRVFNVVVVGILQSFKDCGIVSWDFDEEQHLE